MSFPSFTVLRNWRSSLRADSPPPPLLRPSSLLSAPHQAASYAADLDPAPSEPTTPLPQEDFSYNDASAVTLTTIDQQQNTTTPAQQSPSSSASDTTPGGGGGGGGSLSISSILLTSVA